MSTDPGGVRNANPSRPGLGRRLAANTLYAAVGRFGQLVVWLVFTPAILRSVGPEGFAIWALFFGLTGYLGSLDFGLAQGTLRHVAAARQRGADHESGESATLAVLGFLTLGVVWLVLGLAIRDPLIAWLRIPGPFVSSASLAFPISAGIFVVSGITSVVVAVLQGYGRFDFAARPIVALSVSLAAGFAWVLAAGFGLTGLMWNVLAGWLLALVTGLAHLPAGARGFRWAGPRAARRQLRTAFAFGGPMQLASLLVAFHTQIDKLLLSRLDRLVAVAPYELGVRIATTGGTIPQLMLGALLPEIAGLHEAGENSRLRSLYLRASRWLLAATAVLFAAMIGAADRLYAVWIGSPQPEAALALRVLGVATALALATGVGTTVARGVGRTDLESWSLLAAVAVHVPAAWWLIPRLGLVGALIGYALGTLVAVGWFFALLGRTLGWSLRETLSPLPWAMIATAAGAIVALLLDRALPGASGVAGWMLLGVVAGGGAAATAIVLLVSRYVSIDELRAVVPR